MIDGCAARLSTEGQRLQVKAETSCVFIDLDCLLALLDRLIRPTAGTNYLRENNTPDIYPLGQHYNHWENNPFDHYPLG